MHRWVCARSDVARQVCSENFAASHDGGGLIGARREKKGRGVSFTREMPCARSSVTLHGA